jgi:LacI family transcriptional regulator
MAKTPHVALLIETSHGYGRALLQGIMHYLQRHRPCSVYSQSQGLKAHPPDWLKVWKGDGILVRVEDRAMASAVYQTGLPAVNLRVPFPDLPLPVVGLDNPALGELAFEHLRDRGFRHFAFCGIPRGRYPWMDERWESFEQAVRASGHACHTFVAVKRRKKPPSWEEEQNQIAAWIRTLPKPIGLMAGNDDRGLEVLEACRCADVLVPDEVAVIGVDNANSCATSPTHR